MGRKPEFVRYVVGNSGQGALRLSRETMVGPEFKDSVCSVKDHSEEFEATGMAKHGTFAVDVWEVGEANSSGPDE